MKFSIKKSECKRALVIKTKPSDILAFLKADGRSIKNWRGLIIKVS